MLQRKEYTYITGVEVKLELLHNAERLHQYFYERDLSDEEFDLILDGLEGEVIDEDWEQVAEREYLETDDHEQWANSLIIPDKHPCANCANCIVKLKSTEDGKRIERFAYCKKLKWTPIYLYQIKDKYKYCSDYEPMGEEENFMHDIKKLTYENTTEYKK